MSRLHLHCNQIREVKLAARSTVEADFIDQRELFVMTLEESLSAAESFEEVMKHYAFGIAAGIDSNSLQYTVYCSVCTRPRWKNDSQLVRHALVDRVMTQQKQNLMILTGNHDFSN